MQNAIIEITKETVQNKIYNVRGQQVMLDSDLAEIYGYTTKGFNQQVTRNIAKFESDFMFQLTQVDFENFEYPDKWEEEVYRQVMAQAEAIING